LGVIRINGEYEKALLEIVEQIQTQKKKYRAVNKIIISCMQRKDGGAKNDQKRAARGPHNPIDSGEYIILGTSNTKALATSFSNSVYLLSLD